MNLVADRLGNRVYVYTDFTEHLTGALNKFGRWYWSDRFSVDVVKRKVLINFKSLEYDESVEPFQYFLEKYKLLLNRELVD